MIRTIMLFFSATSFIHCVVQCIINHIQSDAIRVNLQHRGMYQDHLTKVIEECRVVESYLMLSCHGKLSDDITLC